MDNLNTCLHLFIFLFFLTFELLVDLDFPLLSLNRPCFSLVKTDLGKERGFVPFAAAFCFFVFFCFSTLTSERPAERRHKMSPKGLPVTVKACDTPM